jgi:hypothetical protein
MPRQRTTLEKAGNFTMSSPQERPLLKEPNGDYITRANLKKKPDMVEH